MVDIAPEAATRATAEGFVAIVGDVTDDVLHNAAIEDAKAVVVRRTHNTAVLTTLTVRELNATAHIVASGREQENLHLLRQGGADEVIDATAAVGRMLGIATRSPAPSGCSTNSSKRAAVSSSSRLRVTCRLTHPNFPKAPSSSPSFVTDATFGPTQPGTPPGDRLVVLNDRDYEPGS